MKQIIFNVTRYIWISSNVNVHIKQQLTILHIHFIFSVFSPSVHNRKSLLSSYTTLEQEKKREQKENLSGKGPSTAKNAASHAGSLRLQKATVAADAIAQCTYRRISQRATSVLPYTVISKVTVTICEGLLQKLQL